jgi:hypothetical protein
MTASQPTAHDLRPLHAMIRPDIEQPLSPQHDPERRRHPRYSRCLIGQMQAGDRDLSVACVDVSTGGAQVVTPGAVTFENGEQVRVRLDHHTGSYQDDYTVVATESIKTGTAVHLMRA